MVTDTLQVYKCEFCGVVAEVLHGGNGSLVCCGKPMKALKENTVDASKEKHVPVVNGTKVTVGSVPHPMTAEHLIEWIEVVTPDGKVCRQDLKPGQAPEAVFAAIPAGSTVREYCNLHGLWKA